MAEVLSNAGSSTLNGGINSSVTSLVVASAATFPATGTFRIIIDSEIMIVTAVAGTTFTVTRGAESTTAASHLTAAPVTHILTAASVPLFATERIATHTALPDAHHTQAHVISGADHTGTLGTTNYGNATVTYAKVQDVTAASRLLGRGSAAGAGSMQEIALGTNLSMSGTTLNATGGGGGSVASDTIFDAKGDLPAGTGADTAAKLTVGANDTILMADSAQTTGLKWAPAATTADIADVAAAEDAGTTDVWVRGPHVHAHGTGYLPDAHHNQVHGAADHTDITKEIWVPAEALQGDGTSIATVGTGTTGYREFPLADTFDRGVRYLFKVPSDWVSGMSYTLYWTASSTVAGIVIRFQASYLYATAATLMNAAATNETAWSSSVTSTTTDALNIDTERTIATGIAADRLLRVDFRRIASTDAADTYSGAVQIVGVLLKYTASG